MNYFSILEALILASALSVDALLACFAYGSQKIKIPVGSVLTISFVCSGILGLSMLLGAWAAPYIDDGLIRGICFAVLTGLGLMRICDSYLKNLIRKSDNQKGQLKFSAFNLRFILNVYADPERADVDDSRTLSIRESAALSVALSLDGIAAGLGAGLMGTGVALSAGLFFLLTVASVIGGCKLGNRLADRIGFDISWLSGALLILLAFLKL